jgi:hypothetical protein
MLALFTDNVNQHDSYTAGLPQQGEARDGTRETNYKDSDKKKRTFTNLYNARSTWLDLAHKHLDEAVFAAYDWKFDLSDEKILEKLQRLNVERSKQ